MTYTQVKTSSGKVVRVPNEEITKSMNLLKLTRSEAIQMWLEDEGYEVNEEQEALEAKAKANRITATIHQARAEVKQKTQSERVKKEDATKEGVIKAIAEMLPAVGADAVEVVNASKLITFKIGADTFKLDLIRQRPPKAKG